MFDLGGPRRPTACQGTPKDREQAAAQRYVSAISASLVTPAQLVNVPP